MAAKIHQARCDNLPKLVNASDSAISAHLIQSPGSVTSFHRDSFKIISKEHSDYQFKILEAIYMKVEFSRFLENTVY